MGGVVLFGQRLHFSGNFYAPVDTGVVSFVSGAPLLSVVCGPGFERRAFVFFVATLCDAGGVRRAARVGFAEIENGFERKPVFAVNEN